MSGADTRELVLWAIGVVGFLAVAATYLRGSADKGTIVSLKQSVEALEIAGKIKDTEIADLKKKDESKDEKIASMQTELSVLRGVVTAKNEIDALQKSLNSHHTESMKILRVIRDEIGQ